jgi:rsbT co-antagonist protein RsbR
MWNWLKQILSSPVFEDEEKTRTANLLNIVLWVLIFVILMRSIGALLVPSTPTNLLVIFGIFIGIMAALLVLVRVGYVKVTGHILTSLAWIVVTLAIGTTGGLRGSSFWSYAIIILMAGMIMGGWAAVGYSALSIVAGIIIYDLESSGMLTSTPDTNLEAALANTIPRFITIALLVFIYDRGFRKALTRSRRNEQAMAEQAQEIAVFRALAQNAADAILMGTPQGNITYANPAAYAAFGYDNENQELVGKSIPDLLPEAEDEAARQATQSALQGETWRGEIKHQRKDGSVFEASDAVFPVWDDNGEQVTTANIIRDITEERKAQLEREQLQAEREQLQQEALDAQKQVIQELSTPVIPVLNTPQGGIIVMPVVGAIDSIRARDITRSLLAGISRHKARIVILDVTGVSLMDTGIVNHLSKAIQAAQLKGAQTIVTGISDAVAESIVDLGIDWSEITTLSDLQTGLIFALNKMDIKLSQ